MSHTVNSLNNLSDEDAKLLESVVNDAYEKILEAANVVLTRCRKSLLNIQLLQQENPTLSQILSQMQDISTLMQTLNQSGYITFKAEEYVQHVHDIVEAVEASDTNLLEKHVRALNQRSFL